LELRTAIHGINPTWAGQKAGCNAFSDRIETVRGEHSGVSLNQAANSLRRLNISSGGPSAVGAVAITGLPPTSASSNFGMHSFEVPRRGG